MIREQSALVDNETGATVVIQNNVRANHAGWLFHVMGFETKAISEKIEFIGETPTGNRKTHITFYVQGTDGVSLEVYEGPATIVGGATVTPVNLNRAINNDSEITVTKDPTSIATDGDIVFAESVGADKQAGTVGGGIGFILSPGTKYLWRITSLGNDNIISYRAIWAEEKKWQGE
jgi:hypothetical protein